MKKYLHLLLLLILPFALTAQSQLTKAYIQQYKEIAMKEMKRTGIPASITLAQAIVESSSGESNLAKKFNNHFGIKCKLDWKGATTYQDDDTKQECFRVYPNAENSFIDHSNFLKNRPNYASLFELDPVDDTAWAYGLKKAGYATANDYPKKLLKVIDDYELAQYNFPELANEPDDTATAVSTTPIKTNTPKTNSESLALNTIQGISTSNNIHQQLPSMQGIGDLTKSGATNNEATIVPKIALADTSKANTNDNTSHPVKKKLINNYPINTKFKINHSSVIWANEGRSFLEIANTYNVPLYKLYQYNELLASDLVNEDQLIFLTEKKKESAKKVHIVKEGETLYTISQMEGIQLALLKDYNVGIKDADLVAGKIIYLFNMPKDPEPKASSNNKLKTIKPNPIKK
ncbi:MAG: hypothetical protein RLZ56_757 [Bacteroidota bacterium]|jgi:LysM repeat protein